MFDVIPQVKYIAKRENNSETRSSKGTRREMFHMLNKSVCFWLNGKGQCP